MDNSGLNSHYLVQEQAGFVKGKGTREQLLNIRQVIEKSREFNCPVVLCFIDYTKAFDCVQWDNLWTVLREMGTPEHLIGLIQHLYVENRSFVRIGTDCSSVFKTSSPALFNIYGEYIIRKVLENWDKGFPIGGKRISNLRYADDTVLLATSVEDMQELFQRLETESDRMGLTVNRSKTKLMVVDRAKKLPRIVNIVPGVDIVDHYVYLGALIYDDGDCVPEIKRRIGLAKEAMTRLNVIWKKRGITSATKTRLVRALVFPIFLYGVETWTIRARERQRIDAFEMWCWRRVPKINPKVAWNRVSVPLKVPKEQAAPKEKLPGGSVDEEEFTLVSRKKKGAPVDSSVALYVSRLHYTASAAEAVEYVHQKTGYTLRVFQLRSRHYVHFNSFVVRVPRSLQGTIKCADF
ncbi:uncharacterized protein LOC134746908 [Cydia strobilella]|uniref:uncharacterized protein LOC134746908 n=1 Tax=Cydia strobilella TaxID=1100964 RepID=UPI003003BF79